MSNLENTTKEYYNEYEIDLKEIFQTLWDNKWIIILLFIFAVTASAVYSLFMLESEYEAESSLLILPPKYTTSLELATLPVDTYTSLALTHSIKSEIIKELDLKKEDGQAYNPSDLDSMMGVEVEARSQKVDNSLVEVPLLIFKVSGSDPELLSNIANTWAEIFMDTTKKIRSSEGQVVAETIQNQFDDTQQKLLETKEKLKEFNQETRLKLYEEELHIKENYLSNLKDRLISLKNNLGFEKNSYQQLQEEIEKKEDNDKWIGDFNKDISGIEDSQLLKNKNNYIDAQNSLLIFKKEHNSSLLRQSILVKKNELKIYQENIISLNSTLEEKKVEVNKINDLLKNEPERWELKKAVSEDVFWQQILSDEEIRIIENMQLNNEIINPIYQSLSIRLADNKVLVESIPEQIQYYENLVVELEKEIDDMNHKLANWIQEEERLKSNIENYEVLYKNQATTYQELKKEELERQLEIGRLESQLTFHEKEVDSLERDIKDMQDYIWENKIVQEELEQKVDDIQMTYNSLAKRVEEARITESQKTSDVKFIAEAVPPTRAVGPNRKLNVLIAGLLAVMIGVFAVFIKEIMKE